MRAQGGQPRDDGVRMTSDAKTHGLVRQLTVEQAEAEHLVVDEQLGPYPVAFGFQHAAWCAFRAQIQPGDALWEYVSPPMTWRRLCGRQGLALMRGGKLIDSFLTCMS